MTTGRPVQAPVVILAALSIACGALLIAWAGVVLSNIWGYNDSGALTYGLVATILAVPGLGLIGVGAIFARRVPLPPALQLLLLAAFAALLIALLLVSGFVPGLGDEPPGNP